jgi:hypothetical protein
MKVYVVIDSQSASPTNAVLNVYSTRAAARAFIKFLRGGTHWSNTKGRFEILEKEVRE